MACKCGHRKRDHPKMMGNCLGVLMSLLGATQCPCRNYHKRTVKKRKDSKEKAK